MKNSFGLLILVLLFSFSTAQAKPKAHVTKQLVGQAYYLKRCSHCHGEGNRGGNLYSTREWKKIFSAHGADLIELHDGEEGTQKVMKYLKSKDFKKESAKMLKFIQEFAYDSDTIPTCN
ncbi:MAG: cytochrome c [Arcobacteraceae bacterium]|nr:cytochrome c [Arcobacteraceae bacterium]